MLFILHKSQKYKRIVIWKTVLNTLGIFRVVFCLKFEYVM